MPTACHVTAMVLYMSAVQLSYHCDDFGTGLLSHLCVQGPAVCHITGIIHVHCPDPGTLHRFLN